MKARHLKVNLPGRDYSIHIGSAVVEEELRACVANDLSEGRRLAVITDAHVAASQGRILDGVFQSLPRLVLPAGETTKSFVHLQACCDFLATNGMDRRGRVFALGGGVIGDLAGFAAASWLRGVGFYQVPTSLLAMVDSSVGGKTGINLVSGKNLVGAFHQPMAVFADVSVLGTLPQREFSAGMAEIIKHGMLADAELFKRLENVSRLDPQSAELAEVIERNCAIKAAVVLADEREEAAQGGRALLNLGHTFGHAIEAVAGYGAYLHGEAVAIGLVMASRLSVRLGYITESVVERVEALLQRYGLPIRLEKPLPVEALLDAAGRDKKVRRGRMRYIVMSTLGSAIIEDGIDPEWIRELWREFGAAG